MQDKSWYLGSEAALKLDQDLMGDVIGYSEAALMELAGLAVAQACYHFYESTQNFKDTKRVLAMCGPGNNGGDGLVAARHLKLFGFTPIIYYPKRTDKK